jgi:hypothetical protein
MDQNLWMKRAQQTDVLIPYEELKAEFEPPTDTKPLELCAQQFTHRRAQSLNRIEPFLGKIDPSSRLINIAIVNQWSVVAPFTYLKYLQKFNRS